MNKFLNFTPMTQTVSINSFRKPNTMTTDCILDFCQDVEKGHGVNISVDDVQAMLDTLCDIEALSTIDVSQDTIEVVHFTLLNNL